MSAPHNAARVAVCGGGVIGLSIAWRAAQGGLDVTLVDPSPAGAASHAAAGLLAPVFEAKPGEEALLRLNLASYDRWPSFADELTAATGVDLLLRQQGTLAVAFDDDDLRALDDVRSFQESLGLPVERLRSRDCRELEPLLSPRVRGGVRIDSESSVDPRAVCRALIAACTDAGVRLRRDRLAEVTTSGARATGVVLASGETIDADHVVIALGSWSGSLPGVTAAATPPVRPVKGQILRLRFNPDAAPITRNIHAVARGWEIYLVPRTNGELVIGATVEEKGFDTSVTAGGVHEMLQAAIDVLPIVAELEQVEAVARLRPGSADNAPVLGATSIAGLVLATGHYRNGVLLTPITAEAIASLLVDGTVLPEAEPFAIARFAPERRREVLA
jgi:glycine oxidase